MCAPYPFARRRGTLTVRTERARGDVAVGIVTTTKVADGVRQAKKGQGETNDRLEALIAEQRRTNELLLALVQAAQVRS